VTTVLQDEVLPDVVMPTCPIRKALKGQKALVTGASWGIGKGIAIALAHAGADVVVKFKSRPEAAERVAAEARRCGSRACPHQADVADEVQVQAMFRRMIDEYGTIDILVNNAGLFGVRPRVRLVFAPPCRPHGGRQGGTRGAHAPVRGLRGVVHDGRPSRLTSEPAHRRGVRSVRQGVRRLRGGVREVPR
jgi:hypothetical protein